MGTEPMGTTPEGRLAEPSPGPNEQLLAMLLRELMRGHPPFDQGSRVWRQNVWYAAALASALDYPVHFDEKGYLHIYLPVSTESHLEFYLGAIPREPNLLPFIPPQKWAVDEYYERVIPEWQRRRIAETRARREEKLC